MVDFYHHFLPCIAHVLAPITSATKGKDCLTWTPEMTLSFQNAISSLATAVPLNILIPQLPFPLQQKLPIPTWELFSNKKQMVGNPFPFSPKAFRNRNPLFYF
jgi:hypothetical protein